MATLTKLQIDALTLDERFKLIDALWDSFDDSEETLPPPDWHREVLNRILDEDERNPQPTIGWVEVRAELAKKWLR